MMDGRVKLLKTLQKYDERELEMQRQLASLRERATTPECLIDYNTGARAFAQERASMPTRREYILALLARIPEDTDGEVLTDGTEQE